MRQYIHVAIGDGYTEGKLPQGESAEDILADYPDLEPEAIQQSLEYAAWLSREQIITREAG